MKRMSDHEQFQLSLFWLETEGPSRVWRGLFLFLLSPANSAREGCTWCSGEPSHQVAGSKHPVSVFAGEGICTAQHSYMFCRRGICTATFTKDSSSQLRQHDQISHARAHPAASREILGRNIFCCYTRSVEISDLLQRI